MENDQKFLRKKKTDKVRRFDDIFRMLLLVMTVTISIGLNTYSGINLWSTLGYFLMALTLWMFGHLIGSNEFHEDDEIVFKLTAWTFALLVTAVVLTKFTLKVSELGYVVKILIFLITIFVTLLVYSWFRELIHPIARRKFVLNIATILIIYGYGYIAL